MSKTPDYINWYFDQGIAWMGLIVAITLLIIHIKKLSRTKSDEIDKRFKWWIYSMYVSHGLFMAAMCCQVSLLPILKAFNISINQTITCEVILIPMRILISWQHISIFNVFMRRIYILCKGSIFEVSKFRFAMIRIIHSILWITLAVGITFVTDPSPYNVYTSSIDIDNGHTCSTFTSTKIDIYTKMVVVSAAVVIFGGNILAWVLFMCKFVKIIRFLGNDDSFHRVMREQTLIVALAVSSTLLLYLIQVIGVLGQFFVTLDFVLTPIIIVLGLKCNRYYFEFFKCDKLAILCCSICEKRMLAKLSDETTQADIVAQNNQASSGKHTIAHTLPSRTPSLRTFTTGSSNASIIDVSKLHDCNMNKDLEDHQSCDSEVQSEIDNRSTISTFNSNIELSIIEDE